MRRSTSAARRACAVGTTIALIGLTTGLGIMTATPASAATDPAAGSVASAPADAGTAAPADGSSGTGTGTAPQDQTSGDSSTGSVADTPPAGSNSGSGSGSGQTGSDAGAPAGGTGDGTTVGDGSTAAAGEPGTGQTGPATPPTTLAPTVPADQPTKSPRAAAVQTVTIEGDLTVGSLLTLDVEGFTKGAGVVYSWVDEAGDEISDAATYTIEPALAGQRIRVTVSAPTVDETASTVTESAVAPVFVDEQGQPLSDDDSDATIEVTAGVAFSHTYRALSTPAPTLTVQWFDDDGEPQDTLPKGIAFDPETGVLSGTVTEANTYYSFVVTATAKTASGVVSSEQYGDLDIQAGAPFGVEVTSIDKGTLLDGTAENAWIIEPNGQVYTQSLLDDSDPVKGGQVTVKQGGTLLVAGNKVDRWGNQIFPDFDDETGEPVFFTPTVTSDVASDVIAPDSDLGSVGVVSVTFPHASTHTLTVSGASLQSTSFAVDVQPTAVTTVSPTTPAVTVHHTATGTGRLAYTGTDATGALLWALGLVLAGIGLIGARTVRRRRAQR
ncbi:putative Ig domain-containing protein [Curtobacterium sp. UNCCL20]|uniref:putative Ig domain-containing protein n=1 Tax=Curtobacterium sp. UNCCL20 TaxID=1502773 RepID=UPI000B8099C8|nr:putative Ig domain-containing protein [Curtobacterium sp. UNCCL20]